MQTGAYQLWVNLGGDSSPKARICVSTIKFPRASSHPGSMAFHIKEEGSMGRMAWLRAQRGGQMLE